MQSPRATLQEIEAHVQEVRQTLIDKVRDLPEAANGVKKLSNNCATVNFSTIMEHGGILSPRYYLTKDVKENLISRLQHGNTDQIRKLIESILESGKFEQQTLPPNFLAALGKVWTDA